MGTALATEPDNETTIRLHDGEQVTLSASQTDRVYDELWLLANRVKGAIAAASKLKKIDTWTLLHGDDVLNEEETAAFRQACSRLEPAG
jgi:hypothetical protein